MSAPKESVKVSIMQREFTVACSKEEGQSVVEAAAYLDRQMRAVSGGAKVLGIDHCAIMAGLNISHELLALRKAAEDGERMHSRLENLNRQIDETVTEIRQTAAPPADGAAPGSERESASVPAVGRAEHS